MVAFELSPKNLYIPSNFAWQMVMDYKIFTELESAKAAYIRTNLYYAW